jgi:xylulokinase
VLVADRYILSFDLGTGGNKAVLYDSDGLLVGSTFSPYETLYPQSGWAEQRPVDWWMSIVKTTRKLLKETGVEKRHLACIGISGHGIGVVPVDREGRLLREKTLLWSDSRALDQSKNYFKRIDYDHWYSVTGAALRAENYAIFKMMWHRDSEPEMYASTHKFLGTKDFINMKMTGNMVSDFSDASFSGVNDLLQWGYSDELLKPSGIPLEKLPDLVPSTAVVGELLPEPAEELGLAKGVPVICGGYDGSCTALGAGNFKENRVYNYVGSSSWISVAADKPLIDLSIKPYCYFHVIPGMFNSTVSIYSAGGSYQWFRNVLCKEEVSEAERANLDPYEIMEEEARASPVGSNGVMFNPSLMGGSTIHPSPSIRGAFVGLGLDHGKSDLTRAVMEGVAYDLRAVLDRFRDMQIRVDEIRIVGGGSRSRLWRQIFADIYRSKIILTSVGQEAAALGAATVAAVGAGIWKDFSMVDSIAKTIEVSTPMKENVDEYEKRLPLFRFVTEKLLEIGERSADMKE